MGILSRIAGLFKTPNRSLNDLEPREIKIEIRKEKARFERLQEKVEELEVEIEVKYKGSIEKSEPQKEILAIEINFLQEQMDQNMSNIKMHSAAIGTLYTVLGVLQQIKIQFTGYVWDTILNHVTLDDVIEWTEEQNLKQEDILERMKEIRRVKLGGRLSDKKDPKIQEILKRMEAIAVSAEQEKDKEALPEADLEKEPA